VAPLYVGVPWYPPNPAGGAERLARDTVRALRARGVDARVLTTCVADFRDNWGVDTLPKGSAIVDGVPVERFPVDERDWQLFDQVNLRLMRGEPVTDAEARVYVEENIRSRALERRLADLPPDARCVYLPYLHGTTYWGMRARSGWLLPCLHDEPYACLPQVRELFAAATGVLCNATAERDLVLRMFPDVAARTFAVGAGVAIDDAPRCADRFRERTGIRGPFLLCVARKDHGKGVDVLLADFARYAARRQEVDLVLIGPGSIPVPAAARGRVHDLGFVDEELKRDAFAAALAHCSPSLTESFSIVLMESWLAGRPGLVNARCAVTRDHVLRASGGLAYDGADELAGCLDWLLEHPAEAARMGRNGGEYVRRNFSWDVVVARLRRAIGV
jgi:glycosyltransferase involved in cell wall biosynthesis